MTAKCVGRKKEKKERTKNKENSCHVMAVLILITFEQTKLPCQKKKKEFTQALSKRIKMGIIFAANTFWIINTPRPALSLVTKSISKR